ncbi:MAG TPA: anti-sigma factor [Solirubrobacteraceae bacterium]|jgi:anti-sigma factor RsiW|nr:anti-sigma factor [Solirubrobacteraceae bacterium]
MRLWRRRRHDHDALVCREFVELVTEYLEGTLAQEDRERFEAHLAECDGCEGYLEDMRGVIASMHELPPAPPDTATRDALLAALRDLRGTGD